MATHDITLENFESTIEAHDIVILDFWAEWCGPCKMFAPIFEQLSEQHEDVHFGKVNTEDQRALASMFQIRSIPTVMIFRGQIPVFSQPGMLPPQALTSLLEQVKGLDMEDVRKKYDEAVASAGG